MAICCLKLNLGTTQLLYAGRDTTNQVVFHIANQPVFLSGTVVVKGKSFFFFFCEAPEQKKIPDVGVNGSSCCAVGWILFNLLFTLLTVPLTF